MLLVAKGAQPITILAVEEVGSNFLPETMIVHITTTTSTRTTTRSIRAAGTPSQTTAAATINLPGGLATYGTEPTSILRSILLHIHHSRTSPSPAWLAVHKDPDDPRSRRVAHKRDRGRRRGTSSGNSSMVWLPTIRRSFDRPQPPRPVTRVPHGLDGQILAVTMTMMG